MEEIELENQQLNHPLGLNKMKESLTPTLSNLHHRENPEDMSEKEILEDKGLDNGGD